MPFTKGKDKLKGIVQHEPGPGEVNKPITESSISLINFFKALPKEPQNEKVNKNYRHKNHHKVVGKKKSLGGIYSNVLECIGDTPMIRLTGTIPLIKEERTFKGDLLAKCEFLNRTGSSWTRIVLKMLEILEASEKIKKGYTLISIESDALGLALVHIAHVKGYKCINIIPEDISQDKMKAFHACGAYIIRTDSRKSAEFFAYQIMKDNPEAFLIQPDEFDYDVLYSKVAEEIYEQVDGQVDMIVFGENTRITSALRQVFLKGTCKLVGIRRNGWILSQNISNSSSTGAEVPNISNNDLYDADLWLSVGEGEANLMARKLLRIEGLFCGPESGGIVQGALKAIDYFGQIDQIDYRVVVILEECFGTCDRKFLADQSYIDSGYIPYLKMDEYIWWWDISLANVLFDPLLVISSGCQVGDCVENMIKMKIPASVLLDENEELLGITTLSHLLCSLESKKFDQYHSLVKNSPGVLQNFEKINLESKLHQLLDIFKRVQYALIIQTPYQFTRSSKTQEGHTDEIEAKSILSNILVGMKSDFFETTGTPDIKSPIEVKSPISVSDTGLAKEDFAAESSTSSSFSSDEDEDLEGKDKDKSMLDNVAGIRMTIGSNLKVEKTTDTGEKVFKSEKFVGLITQLDVLRYKREAEEIHRIKYGFILRDKL